MVGLRKALDLGLAEVGFRGFPHTPTLLNSGLLLESSGPPFLYLLSISRNP